MTSAVITVVFIVAIIVAGALWFSPEDWKR